MIARLARLLRRRTGNEHGEAGYSLLEVMVGAGIMATVMAVATSGFITMYRAGNLAEASALTQTELSTAFTRLDREVRYAYRVNDPAMAGSDFAVTYVVPDANNQMICVQLTLPQGGGTLLRTQWVRSPENGAAYHLTTSAVANNLISGVAATNDDTVKLNPFTRLEADAGSNLDRLRMRVNSTVGVSEKGAVRNYDLTFTALNTQNTTIDLSCARP